MNRILLSTAVLAASFTLSAQAHALVISKGGLADAASGMTTAETGAIVETFDGQGGFVQPWNWSVGNIVSGGAANLYAAPWGDQTQYYSADPQTGAATVDFGGVYGYLGLYWGSVDAYNAIDLYLDDVLVATITGSDAMDVANGDQGPEGSDYFNITDVMFDSAAFRSAGYAFEFDNLALVTASDIPEPATLTLFGAALAGLGLARRRRKTA